MRRPALATAALFLAAQPLPLAAQAKILLQVRDPEERPVRNMQLSYSGVRSLPTNAEGATELHLPANHPPGLPIKLVLAPNPKKDWFLTNPTINVPAEGFPAELVVMSRAVFRRFAAEAREAQNPARSPSMGPAGDPSSPTLEQLAARYHLKPEQIEEAIRSFGETKSLQDQGIAAYLAGQYAEAEGLFRAASGKAERDFVEAQRYLASSLRAQKKYPEAIAEVRRAIAVQPENPDLLQELGWYLTFVLPDRKEAEVVLRKALSLVERKFGPADDRTGHALSSLATVLEVSRRREEAEPLRWRVLKIAETNHGVDHPDVASALAGLTFVLQARGCSQEALAFYRRALTILESHFGASNFFFQTNLYPMAALFNDLERPREALDLLQRVVPRSEWRFGEDRRPNRNAQGQFYFPADQILKAEVFFQLNRLEEAEVLWRSLVSLLEEHFDPDHPATTERLIRLAEILQVTNRLGEAESLIRRALAFDRKRAQPYRLNIARDLEHLGEVLIATNCLHEAEAALLETLDLYRTLSLEAKRLAPGTDEALERYGRLLKKLGQPEEAVQARLAELRQGLPAATPPPLCTPPPD